MRQRRRCCIAPRRLYVRTFCRATSQLLGCAIVAASLQRHRHRSHRVTSLHRAVPKGGIPTEGTGGCCRLSPRPALAVLSLAVAIAVIVAVALWLPSCQLQLPEKGLSHSSVGAQFGGLRRGIDLHPPAHLPGRVLRERLTLSLSLSSSSSPPFCPPCSSRARRLSRLSNLALSRSAFPFSFLFVAAFPAFSPPAHPIYMCIYMYI